MYIGEPFSWKPAAFEGSNGIMSVTTKETTRTGASSTSTGTSSERALNFREVE